MARKNTPGDATNTDPDAGNEGIPTGAETANTEANPEAAPPQGDTEGQPTADNPNLAPSEVNAEATDPDPARVADPGTPATENLAGSTPGDAGSLPTRDTGTGDVVDGTPGGKVPEGERPSVEEAVAQDNAAPNLAGYVDDVETKGYLGESPDPNPNEAYTVAGVTSGNGPVETVPDPNATGTNPRSFPEVER